MRKASFALLAVLSSCSSVGNVLHRQSKDPSQAEIVLSKSPDGSGAMIPSLRMPGTNPGAGPDAASLGPPTEGAKAEPGSMFDFSAAFDNPGQSRLAHWRRSGTDAIAEARRAGLPLLIFFTHRSISISVDMDTTLSGSPELTSESPRFIPLRIDYSEKATDRSEYYRALRDRYKPRGFPVLVLALPDGTELTRQTGCSADWRHNVNRWLDDAASRARSGIEGHRRRLEGQKYHLWKNKDGQEVFARLESQDANKLVFTNEWGETINTFTNRLSEEDQKRIESGRL